MFIKVKTFPSSKKESIIMKKNDSFEIKVKEDPIEGAATRRVVQLLADYFKIERGKIKIVKGQKERSKIFKLPD